MIGSVARAVLMVSLAAVSTAGAQEFKVPQVGKPAFTKETYKPVLGTYGGRIVRDVLGEPKSFNPVTAGETSTTDYTSRIFEGLTTQDAFTGEFLPQLAESFSVGEDKVTWTFKLKKGITFNDGSPLTAKDVEFTWNECVFDLKRPESAKDPRWPCSMRDIARVSGKPIEVKAVDDYTVEVKTAAPTALLPSWMGYGILPEKVYGGAARDGTLGSAMGTDSKPEQIVGAGPWMLKEYARGTRVVLKRNGKYWKKDSAGNGLPYLDEEWFDVAGNLNIMRLNFEQKITDIYGISSGKEVPEFKKKAAEGNYEVYQIGPAYGMEFLAFNMNEDAAKAGKIPAYKVGWFRDKRFREAVSFAMDRRAQITNILYRLGQPMPGPFTVAPGPLKQEGFAAPATDVEKAKALLAEMGFVKGADGMLMDPKVNQPVALSITTNAGNTIREQYMDFVRKDLEAVGIKVSALPLQFNLLIDKLDNSYDWETIVMGFTGGLEPNDGANFWRSNARLHLWWPKQEKPSFDWEGKINDIFERGLTELDAGKRKAIYREWVQIAVDEMPVIYFPVPDRVVAVRSRFGNLFPSPAPSNPVFHNEEEIFVLPGK